MQRYSEIIRDELGNAIADAEVRVFVGDSSALATVYDGNENVVGQPLATNSKGLIINGAAGTLAKIGFKTTGGRYRLKIKKGADEFELPDVLIGDAQGYDAIDFLSASSDNIYSSTSNGLSATTDGDYFYTADEAGDNLLVLYKNDAGTALELGTLPRASVISGLVDQAEQYRDQIAAFGGYYADTTAGLAGTSDTEIFSVANDPNSGEISVYRNDAGVATKLLTYIPAGPTIDAFLTTLGFTAFTKTLIDDADADTYWATLMASITKATARAELGVDSSTHPVTIIPATDADHILSGAENRADDRTLDATNWSSGHKLICDDANRDFVQRNPTPYTLSVTTSAAGTPAEVSIPPGKSMRVITRQGIGAEPGVSIIQAPVRQTVLTGPVDSNGRADFLAAGTGLEAVTSGLSTDNLIATWGDGFGTYGKIDYASRITSDLTFSSLTDNDTNYLYIDIDPSDGSITAGSTTLAPEYSYAKPAAPATGQYWYPVDHRSRGEYYDGAAWQPVYRLFLGEAVTSGGSVASVVSYVYQGRYRSDVFSVSTSSAYSKNHKIGTDSIRYSVFARESDAYNWALIAGGHTAQNSTANDQNRSGIGAAHNRSIVKLGTGNSAILIGTSANYGLNSNAANAVGTSSVTTAECYIAAERGF